MTDQRAYAEMIASLAITKATLQNNLSLGLALKLEDWDNLLKLLTSLQDLEKTIRLEASRLEMQE